MPIKFPPAGEALWNGPKAYQQAGSGDVYGVERVIKGPAVVIRGPVGRSIILEQGDPACADYLALIPENEISAQVIPLLGKAT